LVYVRGFIKSQTYKVNRYQSILECIWKAKSLLIKDCREILFENGTERLPGNLLSIRVSTRLSQRKKNELRRSIGFFYNVPIQMAGKISKRTVSYHIDSTSDYKTRRAIQFDKDRVFKGMVDNQFYPVEMTKSKIIFMDEFTGKIKLVNWYDSKSKRTSLRYVAGVDYIEQADNNHLCISKKNRLFCYNWSSDAFLLSKTKQISPAYRNYFFYLNHNDRTTNPFPKCLEIKAKIREPLDITALRTKKESINLVVKMNGSGYTKIANSRSIMQNSSLNSLSLLSTSEKNSYVSFHVEKQKEIFYFYKDLKTSSETKIIPTDSTFSFGSTLVDCNISSCKIYNKCQ